MITERSRIVASLENALSTRTGRSLDKIAPDAAGWAKFLGSDCELGYVVGNDAALNVSIDDHFDIQVDVIIRDATLATLGFFHVVPSQERAADESKSVPKFETWLRERINESVYVRHLLLSKSDQLSNRERSLPYTVELTICYSGNGEEILTASGAILREMAQEGSFLHAIGVNFWDVSSTARKDPLPWLLDATCAAIKDESRLLEAASGDEQRKPDPALYSLVLDDFRLPGRRRLAITDEHTVHVIYGPNGSGKSSIVEAVEIALTGRIQRIERLGNEAPDYRKILGNRESGGVPTVTLPGFEPIVIDGRLESKRLLPDGNADSMRLDQDLADRLAASSSAERARIFIDAFFADKRASLESRSAAVLELDRTWSAVPESWRTTFARHSGRSVPPTKLLSDALGWMRGPSLSWKAIRSVLYETFRLTDWGSRLSESKRGDTDEEIGWDEALSRAVEIDAELSALRAQLALRRDQLPIAIAMLERMEGFRASDLPLSDRRLEDLFDEWLSATAESDLATRLLTVSETLERARAIDGPSRPPGREFSFVVESSVANISLRDASVLRTEVDRIVSHASQLRSHLIGASTSKTAGFRERSRSRATAKTAELEVLDTLVADGVLGSEYERCRPRLGQAIRTALEDHRPVDVRSSSGSILLQVGHPAWEQNLLRELHICREDTERMLARGSDSTSCVELLTGLRALSDAVNAMESSDSEAEKQLSALLRDGQGTTGDGALLSALNEMTSLLTPARWAYQRFGAASNFKGKSEIDFRDDDFVSISQRLNTAELNATALAFFLLCARRMPNPLRLLILDDPLQNMDELTVTTVARALCKIVRLWEHLEKDSPKASPWRVWLLLHGQDDAERFRDELPCAFSRLPWSAPIVKGNASTTEQNIECEPSRLARTPQHLAELVTAR